LRVPLRWKHIIGAGTVLALIIFTIRVLPFSFGIHTALTVFIIVVAISRATNIPVTKIFIAVSVNFSVLLLLEYVIMEIFFAATGLDPNTTIAENSNFLWKLSGLRGFVADYCLWWPGFKTREDVVVMSSSLLANFGVLTEQRLI
jgi:hypothetical protein